MSIFKDTLARVDQVQAVKAAGVWFQLMGPYSPLKVKVAVDPRWGGKLMSGLERAKSNNGKRLKKGELAERMRMGDPETMHSGYVFALQGTDTLIAIAAIGPAHEAGKKKGDLVTLLDDDPPEDHIADESDRKALLERPDFVEQVIGRRDVLARADAEDMAIYLGNSAAGSSSPSSGKTSTRRPRRRTKSTKPSTAPKE